MKKTILCIILALGSLGTTLAQDKQKTAVERWNDAMEKAAKAGGLVKDHGEPRIVHRGAKPEVVLRRDQLTYNGKQLKLGQSVEAWDQVLTGQRRCEEGERPTSCVWDELGLQAVLDFKHPGKVKAFYVFLRLPEMMLDTSFQPRKPFSGYLELDGFGIDDQTAFWEVRKASDPKRNLRCGLRDCAQPKGAFGKGVGLYFDLSTPDETGKVSALQLDTY